MSVGYDVYYQNNKVGMVHIDKEGLYYRIQCLCAIPGEDIYRLIAVGENYDKDLGICLREQEKLSLSKRIPIKIFQPENVRFILREHSEFMSSKFIPVYENEEFSHISELVNAKWRCFDSMTGVELKN